MLKVNSFAINSTNIELQARPELLDIVESVAKDKNISIEEVFEAMELAIKKVALTKYGTLYDIRASINRHNGSIVIQKVMTVVSEVENYYHEITLEQAHKINPSLVEGDEIVEYLPAPDFSRGGVQSFRQVIVYKVREAEKQREYDLYKDKLGEIVNGVVKRVEFGNVLVELNNKAEALLRRDQSIPRENLEVGSRIRALIIDIRKDSEGTQIFLSRNNADFVKKLFIQEIPEVYEGIVEIKSIAREAGSRSKVAVITKDTSIDPISVCVGFKGVRIHGILDEIKGEKIDLVHFSDNIATFVVNAFNPIQIAKVIVDEDKKNIEVVVPAESLSLAIGRRGQNINLISKLVGWNIDIMGEEAEKERRQQAMQSKIEYFKESLDVDDVIAQLLVVEGFNSVHDIIENTSALASVPGFNEDIIEELQNRSKGYISNKENEIDVKIKELGVEGNLLNIVSGKKEILVDLAKEGIKTVEDLADLSIFEILDIIDIAKYNISKNEIEDLILRARNLSN